MYPDGQEYLNVSAEDQNQIIGFVRGYVPFVGWIVIGLQRIASMAGGYLVRK